MSQEDMNVTKANAEPEAPTPAEPAVIPGQQEAMAELLDDEPVETSPEPQEAPQEEPTPAVEPEQPSPVETPPESPVAQVEEPVVTPQEQSAQEDPFKLPANEIELLKAANDQLQREIQEIRQASAKAQTQGFPDFVTEGDYEEMFSSPQAVNKVLHKNTQFTLEQAMVNTSKQLEHGLGFFSSMQRDEMLFFIKNQDLLDSGTVQKLGKCVTQLQSANPTVPYSRLLEHAGKLVRGNAQTQPVATVPKQPGFAPVPAPRSPRPSVVLNEQQKAMMDLLQE